MEDEAKIKKAKAKLYNVKSGIEGLIQMMDGGVMTPDLAIDGLGVMVGKAIESYAQESVVS